MVLKLNSDLKSQIYIICVIHCADRLRTSLADDTLPVVLWRLVTPRDIYTDYSVALCGITTSIT
jgi:hypothetical protein